MRISLSKLYENEMNFKDALAEAKTAIEIAFKKKENDLPRYFVQQVKILRFFFFFAIIKKKKFATTASTQATIEQKMGKYEDAIQTLKNVLVLMPKQHLIYHELATIFLKLNRKSEAELNAYEAYQLQPCKFLHFYGF